MRRPPCAGRRRSRPRDPRADLAGAAVPSTLARAPREPRPRSRRFDPRPYRRARMEIGLIGGELRSRDCCAIRWSWASATGPRVQRDSAKVFVRQTGPPGPPAAVRIGPPRHLRGRGPRSSSSAATNAGAADWSDTAGASQSQDLVLVAGSTARLDTRSRIPPRTWIAAHTCSCCETTSCSERSIKRRTDAFKGRVTRYQVNKLQDREGRQDDHQVQGGWIAECRPLSRGRSARGRSAVRYSMKVDGGSTAEDRGSLAGVSRNLGQQEKMFGGPKLQSQPIRQGRSSISSRLRLLTLLAKPLFGARAGAQATTKWGGRYLITAMPDARVPLRKLGNHGEDERARAGIRLQDTYQENRESSDRHDGALQAREDNPLAGCLRMIRYGVLRVLLGAAREVEMRRRVPAGSGSLSKDQFFGCVDPGRPIFGSTS